MAREGVVKTAAVFGLIVTAGLGALVLSPVPSEAKNVGAPPGPGCYEISAAQFGEGQSRMLRDGAVLRETPRPGGGSDYWECFLSAVFPDVLVPERQIQSTPFVGINFGFGLSG